MDDKYVILEAEKYTGLTVGSNVLPPGATFRESAWPWGKPALDGAVKDGRCKKVTEKKSIDNKKGEK